MAKKIFEIAKAQNVSAKDLLAALKEKGIQCTNVMDIVSDENQVVEVAKTLGNAPTKKAEQKNDRRQGDCPRRDDKRPSRPPRDRKDNKPKEVRGEAKKAEEFIPQAEINEEIIDYSGKAKEKAQEIADAKYQDDVDVAAVLGKPKKEEAEEKEVVKVLKYTGDETVGELAEKIGVDAGEVIKKLFLLGKMVTIQQQLDEEEIEILAEEYGFETELEVVIDFTDLSNFDIEEENEENMTSRPPVITIMGHVDHGKTTLLDKIRTSKVVDVEHGGITQHIGAYQVEHEGQKITFLDTPGHEAFTEMRARGSQVTDIVILVVSADDGVMPQTIEAIDHAKAAEVPIIVAVNKIDKPAANPQNVMTQLMEHGLSPEEWGGDTIYSMVSAITGEGIEGLLENILLIAEVHEYKANANRFAFGRVLEAKLDKGRGPVASLLVQKGTLSVGDIITAGFTSGKVRAMMDDAGNPIKQAGPSTPVEIMGLDLVPEAGEIFIEFDNDRKARDVASVVKDKYEKEFRRRTQKSATLEQLASDIEEQEFVNLNVIVKGDVKGTVEALNASLAKVLIDNVRVNVVRSGVGAISEADIVLAEASNAIIIGFNVRPDSTTRKIAEERAVEVRLYNVIYKLIEDLESAALGMLEPEFKEIINGQAEVRDTFKASKIGTIAGCYVLDGSIFRNSKVRVLRDGVVVYDGELASLKHEKDDIKEARTSSECGILVNKFNDVKVGDIIEAYQIEEIERTL